MLVSDGWLNPSELFSNSAKRFEADYPLIAKRRNFGLVAVPSC